jgi:hypothetical protein
MMPVKAMAQDVLNIPFAYTLRDYGLVLALSVFGGVVKWIAKVRNGTVNSWSIGHFIGEITTSAFAGLVVFFICEWYNVPQLLTVALVAVAGHMGGLAIDQIEKYGMRWIKSRLDK